MFSAVSSKAQNPSPQSQSKSLNEKDVLGDVQHQLLKNELNNHDGSDKDLSRLSKLFTAMSWQNHLNNASRYS